ncbi:unnamed protein product [Adineta steineri]|uniref:Transferrin receptor-like dimerisation domain-containing protein n=1 Tax=Adineta steineri TaxID=433720 RepID=A0A814A7R3_9BILA|nr:unnamed protein product [Adineta steineri]
MILFINTSIAIRCLKKTSFMVELVLSTALCVISIVDRCCYTFTRVNINSSTTRKATTDIDDSAFRTNRYNARGFPTITDAIEDRNITNIQQQISIVTYFIHSAITVLQSPNKIQSI